MSDTFKKEWRDLSAENASLIRKIKLYAEGIEELMMPIKSREMSLAMTNLEQACMWMTKAIVIHDEQEDRAED